MTKPMTMTSENGAPAFWLTPEWPLPPGVGACQTTRLGGVSLPPYQSLNLGLHVQDEPQAVAENRRRLAACLPAAAAVLRVPSISGTVSFMRSCDAAPVPLSE